MHLALTWILAGLFVLVDGKTAVVPADVSRDGVFVHAMVDGHPLLFQIDSGAEGMVIDARAAAGIGLAPNHVATDLSIGSLHASNVHFDVIGYDRQENGKPVAGIIGFPFFRSNPVGIDYPRHTLTVYGDDFDPASLGAPAQPIQLIDGVRASLVHVWFAGRRATMLLDTGSSITILWPATADHLAGDYGDNREMRLAYERTAYGRSKTVHNVQFGSLLLHNLTVIVPDADFAPSPQYDGILGRDVLSLVTIVIDYAHSAIYVVPSN
jgi:predicted aspartyl protease